MTHEEAVAACSPKAASAAHLIDPSQRHAPNRPSFT